MGIEEGNTRSYFQPIFLRQTQTPSTKSLFIYTSIFIQMSVMHSKPISDEEIGQNIKSRFNFRGHNL